MPFRVHVFRENVARWAGEAVEGELAPACTAYGTLTTPRQRAQAIGEMMALLDREVD